MKKIKTTQDGKTWRLEFVEGINEYAVYTIRGKKMISYMSVEKLNLMIQSGSMIEL